MLFQSLIILQKIQVLNILLCTGYFPSFKSPNSTENHHRSTPTFSRVQTEGKGVVFVSLRIKVYISWQFLLLFFFSYMCKWKFPIFSWQNSWTVASSEINQRLVSKKEQLLTNLFAFQGQGKWNVYKFISAARWMYWLWMFFITKCFSTLESSEYYQALEKYHNYSTSNPLPSPTSIKVPDITIFFHTTYLPLYLIHVSNSYKMLFCEGIPDFL